MNGYISKSTSAWLIATAVVVDIVQFLLGLTFVGNLITPVIAILAWMGFYMVFKQHGISFSSPKRMLSLGGGFLIEILPVINLLPAWTLAVLLVISTAKLPVALGGKGAKKPQKGEDEEDGDEYSEYDDSDDGSDEEQDEQEESEEE